MSDQQASNETTTIHYEGGIPVLDTRISEVERKQAEAESRDQRYKEQQIFLNRRLVRATVALVVATIVMGMVGAIQVWYVHRQWKLTSDGLSKMGDQIWAAKDAAYASKRASDTASQTLGQMQAQTRAQQIAATASKIQADAAKKSTENGTQSLQATIESFHLDQRPWVIPFQFQLAAELENGKDSKVTIWVENTGKTPALDMIPVSSVSLWDFEPPEPDLSKVIPIVSRGILAPGFRNFSFDTEGDHFKPKLVDIAAYQDGRKRIYIHGMIRYRDSFNLQRWTKFCIWHKYGSPLDNFSYCEHGNDVDHEEEHKQ